MNSKKANMSLLEIKDIVFETGDKKILDGLSLNTGHSEIHALLGTNGTGKSTLAYLIMGCEGYKPLSGEIIFDGKVVNDLKIHERAELGITMAWQEPVRFEGISVKDYITLKNKDVDPSHYLEMAGLHPELYLHRMADKSLSGGERWPNITNQGNALCAEMRCARMSEISNLIFLLVAMPTGRLTPP